MFCMKRIWEQKEVRSQGERLPIPTRNGGHYEEIILTIWLMDAISMSLNLQLTRQETAQMDTTIQVSAVKGLTK